MEIHHDCLTEPADPLLRAFTRGLTTSPEDATERGVRTATTPTYIQSVQRALHLVAAVGEADQPQPAKQLARKTGIALPTAYHLLRTLVHEGYLVKVEDGYMLGPMIGEILGRRQTQTTRSLQARSILRELRDASRCSAYLSVFRDGEIVLVDILRSASPHQIDIWPGAQPFGHATAFGKCILAQLDVGTRMAYLGRHALASLTPKTVTERRSLDARLESCEAVAVDREEYRLGTSCIAVPVITPDVVGAVALSAHSAHYEAMIKHLSALRVAATALGFALGSRE